MILSDYIERSIATVFLWQRLGKGHVLKGLDTESLRKLSRKSGAQEVSKKNESTSVEKN